MNEKEIIDAIDNLTSDQVFEVINEIVEQLENPSDPRFKLKYLTLPKKEYARYFGTPEVPVVKGTIPGPNRNFHKNNKATNAKRRLASCNK